MRWGDDNFEGQFSADDGCCEGYLPSQALRL